MARLRSQYRDPSKPKKLEGKKSSQTPRTFVPFSVDGRINQPIRYEPLSEDLRAEEMVREIIRDIHQRLRGWTITPKVAGMFRVAIEDEIRQVTQPDSDDLRQIFQELGDAFFRLGRANSKLAQSYWSMNPASDKKGVKQ